MKSRYLLFSVLLSALFISTIILSRDYIFFGDMVQFGSRHAHFFYENNFQTLWLPTSIDSGHPPLFGMYMASCWKIFGKSLLVSHFALLPFVIALAFGIVKLMGSKYESLLFLGVLVFYFEPTLSAQITVISPDIILVTFFVWALNAINSGKYSIASILLIPLAAISLRGMMVVFALFIAQLLYLIFSKEKLSPSSIFKIISIYLPAGLMTSAWLLLHYMQSGWIGFHAESPWASSFEQVGFASMLKNLGLMIWRWLDFGRFVLFAFLLHLVWRNRRENWALLHYVLLSLTFVFSTSTLFAEGLVGHRYYLPIYISSIIIVIQFLELEGTRFRSAIMTMILFAFIWGGNWIYPTRIAMGWDATPAHRSYYPLRDSAMNYLEKNKIELSDVAAGFPNLDSRKNLELKNDTSSFVSYASRPYHYILYSNIYNYPDAIINYCEQAEVCASYEKKGVFVKIMRVPTGFIEH